ncbi:MAG: hypothetical protein R2911_12915 [Caldilineaceae bacterium]
MTIVLEVAPELESQIHEAAKDAGISTDAFILESIQKRLAQGKQPAVRHTQLPKLEVDLIQKINQSMSQIQWGRYKELLAKRQSESLTSDEQRELIAFSDQIEAANVKRIEFVAELAQLRQTTIPVIMRELGLKPTAYV